MGPNGRGKKKKGYAENKRQRPYLQKASTTGNNSKQHLLRVYCLRADLPLRGRSQGEGGKEKKGQTNNRRKKELNPTSHSEKNKPGCNQPTPACSANPGLGGWGGGKEKRGPYKKGGTTTQRTLKDKTRHKQSKRLLEKTRQRSRGGKGVESPETLDMIDETSPCRAMRRGERGLNRRHHEQQTE